jgi:hypothetical protein
MFVCSSGFEVAGDDKKSSSLIVLNAFSVIKPELVSFNLNTNLGEDQRTFNIADRS